MIADSSSSRGSPEEADQHPYREGQGERGVGQDQRRVRVDEPEVGHDLEIGDHEERLGQHLREEKEEDEHQLAAHEEAGEAVGGEGGEAGREQGRTRGDEQAVGEIAQDGPRLDQRPVGVEGPCRGEEGRRRLEDLVGRLQRRVDHPVEREEHHDEGREQDHPTEHRAGIHGPRHDSDARPGRVRRM
ncbi:MAG: hypothetical protein R3D25_07300 [Geminicoccaceae bacterium]